MEDVTEDQDPAPIDSDDTKTLSERVDAVERLLLHLIEQISHEVRTRRVAVIEDDGFERVAIEATGTRGGLTVSARGGIGCGTAAEIYAHDASEGDSATAGVALVRDGDIEWTADLLGLRED